METMRRLKPVLDGQWWLIGPSPDLRGILPHAAAWKGRYGEHNAPVDHHLVRGPDGVWHLWGCVRNTVVGRILYHWTSDTLFASPWKCTGEIIRVDQSAGESYGSSPGEGADTDQKEECIQSPFFVHHDNVYYMFYGGGGTPLVDDRGAPLPQERQIRHRASQMCLMTSRDCRHWTRHRDADGYSRLFVGPGPTRDPYVIRIDNLWYLYYAGGKNDDLDQPVFWARTSTDLLHWSEPRVVHDDLRYGPGRWDTECPVVVRRDGYYYLFRTEDYYQARTHVFCSEDPLDFGIGDASGRYVGVFPAGAPEVYVIDGVEYVSSNHNPPLGTQMCRMTWVEDA